MAVGTPETTTTDTESTDQESTGKSMYMYPLDLRDHEDRETIRFTIKDRRNTELKAKSIYLYCPPGISVADGMNFGGLDLGVIGGIQYGMQQGRYGGENVIKGMTWDDTIGNTVTVARENMDIGNIIKDIAAGVGVHGKDLLGSLGGKSLIEAGTAINNFTVQQFSGVTPRSFTFSFKLVAQSEEEGEECKNIENTFRKFMYPELETQTPIFFKYPPYWQIEFLKGEDKNKNLPYINWCYLQSMTASYNATTNAFHANGEPTEIDISLTFAENKTMSRDELYKDPNDYEPNPEYSYKYGGAGSTWAEVKEIAADQLADGGEASGD